MSAKTKPRQYPELKLPPRSKNLPATQGMLQLVRTGLKEDIRELRSEMKSEFKLVDARFNQVDAQFKQVNAQFSALHAEVQKVMMAVHHVASEVARVGVLVEEQNSRNRIVLEGLTGLAQRQDRLESRVDETEKTIRSIGRSKS